jgi:hypothetical protein
MSAPAKINIRCSVCGFAVTTLDELVVGAYNGAPNERFDLLWAPGAQEDDTFGSLLPNGVVPDGYAAYCLDDSPCECGYHPDFMSDTVAQEEGYCFNPDCTGHNPVRMAHKHEGDDDTAFLLTAIA